MLIGNAIASRRYGMKVSNRQAFALGIAAPVLLRLKPCALSRL